MRVRSSVWRLALAVAWVAAGMWRSSYQCMLRRARSSTSAVIPIEVIEAVSWCEYNTRLVSECRPSPSHSIRSSKAPPPPSPREISWPRRRGCAFSPRGVPLGRTRPRERDAETERTLAYPSHSTTIPSRNSPSTYIQHADRVFTCMHCDQRRKELMQGNSTASHWAERARRGRDLGQEDAPRSLAV